MQFGDVAYNGAAIKEFFADGGTTHTPLLMDDCVNCLSYNDRVHRPECYGYRIFIGPRISAILHPEALTTGKSVPSFNMEHLVHRLNQILPRTDPTKAKLIHLVMYDGQHFSLYCINIEHIHVHILDPLDYVSLNKKYGEHRHKPTMDLIQMRLNQALQTINKRFPNFGSWRRSVLKTVPVARATNDCAALVMRYLEGFDGLDIMLPPDFDPANTDRSRSEMLHYMMFHQLNLIKDHPPEIGRFKHAGVPF
ncbi:unnamed protein product [Urochloa decumbens]|uniref:Ubiquitin-like protease family profile domain-containing protein n=1 Tax=Urochloa decumbens TaxID=240449 RepID=A0ABC9GT31_9POAL